MEHSRKGEEGGARLWGRVCVCVRWVGGSVGRLSVNGIVTLQPPPPLAELGVRET